LLGTIFSESSNGALPIFSADQKANLLTISEKAFLNDKIGGMSVGSPLYISATYQGFLGNAEKLGAR
jgi:hypothetical protein